MTLRACRACGGWHRLEEEWPAECYSHFGKLNDKRSDLAAPNFIKDEMPALRSQVTGKVYDSKSGLRKEYKAHGVVEVGNDKQAATASKRPKISKHDIGEAIDKVRQGYRPNADSAVISNPTTGWH